MQFSVGERRANDILTQAEAIRVRVELATIFNPSGPVSDTDLFQGRRSEIDRILSAVSQHGQHVILFGERGVGKTSLASLTHAFWANYARETTGFVALRYNCAPDDTFATIWARIAELLTDEYTKQDRSPPTGETWLDLLAEVTHEAGTPHSVRRLLDLMNELLIVVIDEFDQLSDEDSVQQFASLIKALSDHLSPSTLILVGVADSVDDLIESHASIDRATIQVALPRMSKRELGDIVRNRYDLAGLSAAPDLIGRIARLSQGLPHYAHRLGQEAGYSAVDRNRLSVNEQDVERAVEMAIEHTQKSIRMAYRDATRSNRRDALFDKVLLACALAHGDDLGFFAPSEIREPLERVAGKPYDFPQFVRHLQQFASSQRGQVLQVSGERRKRRYRFTNPLLRPYVVLEGVNAGTIDMGILSEFDAEGDASLEDDGQSRLL